MTSISPLIPKTVEYLVLDGHPICRIGFDGGLWADVSSEQKETLVKNGIVSLSGDLEDYLPLIPVPGIKGMVSGCTKDPLLVRIITDFCQNCARGTFIEGLKPVPKI